MAKKFDLAAALAEIQPPVSDSDTSLQVTMIPLEDILPSPGNFYRVDPRELTGLADSIAMDGLLDPLVVTADREQPGKYRLISGHRRRAAIELLVEDKAHPREDLRNVPCILRSYASDALAQLQLILANATARTLTNAEISKQAEQMELLLYQLKEEGYTFPGRMRDQVAAACKVSAPKLARLKVIREKLTADYRQLFEKDKLPEQTAYALARMPAEFQQRLSAVLPKPPDGSTAERLLKKYESGWRWEPELQCPDGKACKRGDTFLRHDADHPYDMCGGKRCCLNCERAKESYAPCDRMCSRAKEFRKEVRDAKKEKEDAERQRNTQRYQEETRKNAQRLLLVIDAAGLGEDVTIPWEYWNPIPVKTVRAYAAGEFPVGSTWYAASLKPEKLAHPKETAKLLKCSTDYLLGLTDDPTPNGSAPTLEDARAEADQRAAETARDRMAAEMKMANARMEDLAGQLAARSWQSGPLPLGRAFWLVARLDLGEGRTMRSQLWWDGTHLRFSPTGENLDESVTVRRWVELPPEPEEGEAV